MSGTPRYVLELHLRKFAFKYDWPATPHRSHQLAQVLTKTTPSRPLKLRSFATSQLRKFAFSLFKSMTGRFEIRQWTPQTLPPLPVLPANHRLNHVGLCFGSLAPVVENVDSARSRYGHLYSATHCHDSAYVSVLTDNQCSVTRLNRSAQTVADAMSIFSDVTGVRMLVVAEPKTSKTSRGLPDTNR
jgi:hypothetical protein